MRVVTLLMLALLLVPFAVATSVHDRNFAFLESLAPDLALDEPVVTHDGRALTLGQALDEAAARAGSRDLAAPFDPLEDEWHGIDVWVLEWGPGPCAYTVLGPGMPIGYYHDQPFWVYEGETAVMGGDSDVLYAIGWATYTFSYHEPGHWWAAGNTDWWCVGTETGHFSFPFINGYVTAGEGYQGE